MKWLDKYDAPKAQNGIEGTMSGLTDKGFNYNGAWGGQFQEGGLIPMAQNGKKKPLYKKQGVEEIEHRVDNFLGNPQKRAQSMADINPDEDPVDNIRHSFAGRYTQDAIAKKLGNGIVGNIAGLIGSNALGAAHEIGTLSNDKRDWSTKLREAGEDIFNNAVGSLVGAIPFMDEKAKDKMMYKMAYGNLLPDGYVSTEKGRKKGLSDNVYFKNKKGEIKRNYEMGGSIPGSVGFTYARTQGIPSEGKYAKKTMPSAQNGVDMYGNPIIANIRRDESVARTNYNPRTNTIMFGSDLPLFLSPEILEKTLAHENRHAWQFANDRTNFNIVHNPEYAFQDRLMKKPEQPSTDEVFENYHNRKAIESGIDVKRFKENNPSFSYVPNQIIYNKVVDHDQYKNPESVEGEAEYYQETGQQFQNGGEMKYYQHGLDFKPKGMKNGGWLDSYDVPQAQDGFYTPKKLDTNAAKKILKNINKRKTDTTGIVSGLKSIRERETIRPTVARDNTRVKSTFNERKFDPNAKNKTDEEIAAERKARIADSMAAQKESYNSDNWRELLARETQATGDKLRISLKPNFFDDYLNPAAMIGDMASGLGQAPYLAKETNSYLPYVVGVGAPLLTGALEGIGAKNTRQFINNLINPLNIVPGYKSAEKYAVKKLKNIRTNVVPKPSSVSSSVDNIGRNLSDLKEAQKFAKKYGYKLPTNLERISQSDVLTDRTIRGMMNRHNTFVRGVSTNWEVLGQKNPEIIRHLEGKGFNLGTEEGSKAAAEYMATHIPFDTGYGRFGLNKGEHALYLSNSVPTAEAYTYGNGYIVKAKRPTDFSSASRQDWLTANDFDAHLDFKGSPFGQGIVKNDYIKRFPTNFRETLAITGDPDKFTALQKTVREKEALYNDLSHESWRKHNNLISDLKYRTDANYRNHIISDDPFVRDAPNFFDRMQLNYLQNKRDFMQNYYRVLPLKDIAVGVYGDPDVWKAFGKNLFSKLDPFSHYAIKGQEGEKVLEALKSTKVTPDIWQNTSRLHVNKYSNKLSRRKDGGVIKDDMGQWAHPGEITQIDSPYITMKGVPYPVLGISNTGDMQMMYPEEEYEFDGDSVTEYPMAKNGINNLDARPLRRLDDLTNFTNYNSTKKSGWLSKYE